jgi:hypothetical protein
MRFGGDLPSMFAGFTPSPLAQSLDTRAPNETGLSNAG